MLVTGLRALQLGLAGLGLYLLSAAVSPLVGASPSPRLDLPDVAAPADPGSGAGRYAVISERNLFHTREEPLAAPLAEEPVAETRLSVRLLGTTVAIAPELSVASVEDLARRETLALRTDDEVAGARIVRIERRRIVLDNDGVLEWLSLEDEEPVPVAARSAQPTERTLNAAGGASRQIPRIVSAAERVGRAARGASRARTSGGGAAGAGATAGGAAGGGERTAPGRDDSLFRGDPQIVESDPDDRPPVRDRSLAPPVNQAPIHGFESALEAVIGTGAVPLLPGETIVAAGGASVSSPGGREAALREFQARGHTVLTIQGEDGSTRSVDVFLGAGGPRR